MSLRLADRFWRVVATGFSFTAFGLGALLLSVTVFPLLALVSRDADRRRARVQGVLHYGCRWFAWLLRVLGLITCEVHGVERLMPRGRMIVANHPSLIDVVFLLAWLPQADCIMKQALTANPFLRWTVAWAGYIGNASPAGLIDDCAATLRAGRTLIVFPEGTRTVPGRPPQFKRGAARIALLAGAELVPVQIRCEPTTLTKHAPWWQVPERPSHFTYVVGEPFSATRIIRPDDTPAQAARRLTAHLQKLLVPTSPAASATAELSISRF